MSRKLFVNLAVRSLDASVAFFTELGFAFDKNFTDENATAMIINDDTSVMLLEERYFSTFSKKSLIDASTQVEVIMAIAANTREEVDELVNKALAAGGSRSGDPQDHGLMYGWSFQDIDGHQWEVVWMDPAGLPQQ